MIQNLLRYHLAHLCNIVINFKMFWNNYQYILSNYILAILYQISLALYIYILFISVLQLINGAQFLNITSLFLSSTCLAASSAPASGIVILPLKIVYASLESHKLDFKIVDLRF